MIHSSIGERPEELRARLDGEAHLWLSDLDSWRASPVLTAEEGDRARTLRHPGAQASFVAGRSLLRFALSHYAELEPTDWEFRANSLGRPEIAGPEPVSDLRFNLSHTRDLAACVVTRRHDCGVDVEALDRPLRHLQIAEHSFAPEEHRDLEERGPEDLRERFFSYWTLKEAYYKARGSGIPFRMADARFELGAATGLDFSPSPKEEAVAADWQFALYRPTQEHILAVAVTPGSGHGLGVRCFSALGGEGDFTRSDIASVRASSAEIPA